MSMFSDQVAFGAAMLSGVVVMIFGYVAWNGIKKIVADCRHKNHAMAVRNRH